MNPEEQFLEHHPIIFTAAQLISSSPPHSPERSIRSPLKELSVKDTSHAENHVVTSETTIKSPLDHPSNQQQTEHLLARIDSLQIKHNEYKASMDSHIESFKNDNRSLQEELDCLKARYVQLQDDHSSLQARYDAYIAQQDILHQTISTLQTENRATTSAFTELQSNNAALSSRIDSLTHQEHIHKTELSSMLRETQRLTQDNKFLSAQLHQMTELLHKLAPLPMSVPTTTPGGTVATTSAGSTSKIRAFDGGHGEGISSDASKNSQGYTPLPVPDSIKDDQQINTTLHENNTATIPALQQLPKEESILLLEESLLSLNQERDQLESELGKYPSHHNGKTLADRRRKKDIEHRLGEIAKEIGTAKRSLKRLGAL